MSLPQYKLVFWRKEKVHKDDPYFHTTVLDYMENPIPNLSEDSLLGLVGSSLYTLELTGNILERTNSTQEVKMSSSKYVLAAVDLGNTSVSRAFVLKLVDFSARSSVLVNSITVLSKGSKSIVLNRNFPPQYKFVVISTNKDEYLSHRWYDCADDPIPGVHQSSQLISICSWPETYHQFINKLTNKLNSNQEVLGASGKYYLSKAGIHEDGKSRYVVWRFVRAESHSVDL
ncbi:hypothetical protein H072_4789 [Dactylellina haptotyla CBS 200.50]|uniref:Uncharacterized protein n=1 Tax=Dactylellina haptotyla (strain CBS 200.50) TaxID=1284197 RepID=S8BNZ7_DACHA|nr:hypothetical protein H072_4789 [Dactylellina haptotyla CBS 200.50]